MSGLVKLLHPDGEVTKAEVSEYLAYAIEMRRRVKEQLKKMGGLEYWDTSLSYIDLEGGEETFVRLPEMGGERVIGEGLLSPGSIYTIGTDAADNRLALFLLQTQNESGLWSDNSPWEPIEPDEGGHQDGRCLPEGKPKESWNRP